MSRSRLRAGWRLLRQPPAPLKAVIFLAAAIAYATTGFMFFEYADRPELDWLDGFWWTIVTMATVGFGDYFPATTGGRLFVGIPTMLIGVGMLGYALGQVATFFIRAEALHRKGFAMHKLTGHVIICNYPSRAWFVRVTDELRAAPELAGVAVALVDEKLEELDAELAAREVAFVRGHPAREHTLRRAAVDKAARAIVLSRNPADPVSDELSVATVLTLKHLSPYLHVVAECVDPDNQETLRRAGCDSVVCVHDLAPGLLARELTEPGLVKVLEQLSSWSQSAHKLYLVPIELDDGRQARVRDLIVRLADRGATVLGIRSGGEIVLNPPVERALSSEDAAVVLASKRPGPIRI